MTSFCGASVIGTECIPPSGVLASDNSSYGKINCYVHTSDAGVFLVTISSQATPIRTNTQGDIRSSDLPGIKSRVQAAYRAAIIAKRAEQVVVNAEDLKRNNAFFRMSQGETE